MSKKGRRVTRELGRFLSLASKNERRVLRANQDIFDLVDRVIECWSYMTPKSPSKTGARLLPWLLYYNSYGSYLAACRIASSGQSPPTFVVLRSSLESAVYALIAKDPAKEQIWYNRHNDRSAVGREFTVNKGRSLIEDGELSKAIKDHYNHMIDLGGHPNLESIVNHVTIGEPTDGGLPITLGILHSEDQFEVLRSFIGCVEVGVAILLLGQYVFPESDRAIQAAEQALAILEELETVIQKRGLQVHSREDS